MNLAKWLRDPLWQFILGTITIILTVIFFFVQQQRKEISYEIAQQTSLFSINEQVSGEIQVLFNEKPVENLHLIVVRLHNTGNIPVVRTDFDQPITITFQDGSEIISAEVLSEESLDVMAEVTISQNEIAIEPALINGGESIKIKAIINNYREGVIVSARIVGVNQIALRDTRAQRVIIANSIAVIAFAFQILGLIIGLRYRRTNSQSSKPAIALTTLCFFIAFVLVVASSQIR